MRIVDIVNTNLDNDILVAEQELERMVNSDNIETHSRVSQIKEQLNKIILSQLVKAKWCDYISNHNDKE